MNVDLSKEDLARLVSWYQNNKYLPTIFDYELKAKLEAWLV